MLQLRKFVQQLLPLCEVQWLVAKVMTPLSHVHFMDLYISYFLLWYHITWFLSLEWRLRTNGIIGLSWIWIIWSYLSAYFVTLSLTYILHWDLVTYIMGYTFWLHCSEMFVFFVSLISLYRLTAEFQKYRQVSALVTQEILQTVNSFSFFSRQRIFFNIVYCLYKNEEFVHCINSQSVQPDKKFHVIFLCLLYCL